MKEEEKKEILGFAYECLFSLFTYEKVDMKECDAMCGAFVTLRKNGELRGCIGYIYPVAPLYEMVRMLVRDAAFNDCRFKPLRKDELSSISLEISLLTPMKDIKSLDEFRLGTDGLMMSLRGRRALFLPDVADETGWDEVTFFEQLCLKAGLAKDAYKDKEASFMTFQSEVIR